MVSTAVPALYGCTDGDEVKEHLTAQSLTGVKVRMHVRGVLCSESGATRRYVAAMEPTPLEANTCPRTHSAPAWACRW